MLRFVLTIFVVYSVLLVVFVGLRHYQLTADINNRITDVAVKLIDSNPVDHKQTLFSGILLEHANKTSQYNPENWSRTVSEHKLVVMSPCNPRIKRCS